MGARRNFLVALLVVVAGITSITVGLGWLALSASDDTAREPANGTIAEPLAVDESVVALHESGVTGENVTVGVLDVTGYDLTRAEFDGRVVETREFGADAPSVDGGNVHGTAAASTVARVAPEADIYLATFATPAGYGRALDWLAAEGVDVVVTPVSQSGTLGDGDSQLARATTDAVEDGLVVVAPAGNVAQGHWLGRYEPTATGRHSFDGGPLNHLEGNATRAEIQLAWEQGVDEDYTLELHRIDGNQTELVAQSVRDEEGTVPHERLTAVLDDDRYAVAIDGPAEPTGTVLRVASPTHSFSQPRPKRSIVAPGAARGAITVGAVDPATGETEPFSSRGPTLDGRYGVDVVAPNRQPIPGTTVEFTGTSASAAFVGGVAALSLDAAPDLSPADVRRAIASGTGSADRTVTRGHGQVNPRATVRSAVDRSRSPRARTSVRIAGREPAGEVRGGD